MTAGAAPGRCPLSAGDEDGYEAACQANDPDEQPYETSAAGQSLLIARRADDRPRNIGTLRAAAEPGSAPGGITSANPIMIRKTEPRHLVLPTATTVSVCRVSLRRHVARACGSFCDAVCEGQLRHFGDPALEAAVTGVRRRQLGDAWAWSRTSTELPVSFLVRRTRSRPSSSHSRRPMNATDRSCHVRTQPDVAMNSS